MTIQKNWRKKSGISLIGLTTTLNKYATSIGRMDRLKKKTHFFENFLFFCYKSYTRKKTIIVVTNLANPPMRKYSMPLSLMGILELSLAQMVKLARRNHFILFSVCITWLKWYRSPPVCLASLSCPQTYATCSALTCPWYHFWIDPIQAPYPSILP